MPVGTRAHISRRKGGAKGRATGSPTCEKNFAGAAGCVQCARDDNHGLSQAGRQQVGTLLQLPERVERGKVDRAVANDVDIVAGQGADTVKEKALKIRAEPRRVQVLVGKVDDSHIRDAEAVHIGQQLLAYPAGVISRCCGFSIEALLDHTCQKSARKFQPHLSVTFVRTLLRLRWRPVPRRRLVAAIRH